MTEGENVTDEPTEPETEDVVWRQTVDNGRYEAKVVGGEPYRGTLYVTDLQTGKPMGEPREVSLSYNAQFGPDVMDVADWQAMTLEVLPEPEAEPEENQ